MEKFAITPEQYQEIVDTINQSCEPQTSIWDKDRLVQKCVMTFKVGMTIAATYSKESQEELFNTFREKVLTPTKRDYQERKNKNN